jgi:hypothetical protein
MGDEMQPSAAQADRPAPTLIQATIYFLMAVGHCLNTITPIIQIGFSQFMEIKNAVAQPTGPADGTKPRPPGDSPISGRSPSAGPWGKTVS